MKRTLCIISVYRPDLLAEAVHALGVSRDAVVFIDRRVGERRRSPRPDSETARLYDRRQHSVEDTLRAEGFAVVSTGE